jgi:hypothetical protein
MSEIREIQEKLQDTNAAIARIERSIAANPHFPSLVANLRSLEKRREDLQRDFRAEAHRLEFHVCHYRVLFDGRATLAGVTRVLTDFQNLFSLVYDALKNGPKLRARLGPDTLNESALGFAYSYSGSIGVVLTISNEQVSTVGRLLDETIRSTLGLVQASDSATLSEFSKRLGLPPVRAAYKWADEQLRLGIASSVEWRHQQQVRASLSIQRPELERFLAIADETTEQTSEEETANVELVGADVLNRRFHLRLDNGLSVRVPG